MEVTTLTREHEELYCLCLKEYSGNMALGADRLGQPAAPAPWLLTRPQTREATLLSRGR